ncbi:hypothetical protein A4X09_0g7213 [Tilletia walkeri]|uniref:Uncharacterized protein n=1 Tax=Tilletia walkeri TaxID=117179 RepID=A0A8X7N3X4_9BASI|nr:hypothetical protein A4X09_0g7213 [Tilletia walkeri]
MWQDSSTRGLAALSSGMEDKTTAETKDDRASDAEEQVTDEANDRTIPRRFLVLSNQEDEELQAALDLAEVALGETNVDDAPDELDKTVNNSAPPIPCGCGPSPTAALIISCSTPHKERSYVISA